MLFFWRCGCLHRGFQVDVCLYFIAAHRLKFIDIKFMQAISTNVAIIPIIAKADSYVHWLSAGAPGCLKAL